MSDENPDNAPVEDAPESTGETISEAPAEEETSEAPAE